MCREKGGGQRGRMDGEYLRRVCVQTYLAFHRASANKLHHSRAHPLGHSGLSKNISGKRLRSLCICQ